MWNSGLGVIRLLSTSFELLLEKHPIRTLYPLNITFWLEHFGVAELSTYNSNIWLIHSKVIDMPIYSQTCLSDPLYITTSFVSRPHFNRYGLWQWDVVSRSCKYQLDGYWQQPLHQLVKTDIFPKSGLCMLTRQELSISHKKADYFAFPFHG
jgi:hypothetical protein